MSTYPLHNTDLFPGDPLGFDVGGEFTIDFSIDWTALYLAFPPYYNDNALQYVSDITTNPPSGSSAAPLQTASGFNSTQQLLALPPSLPRRFDSKPVTGPSSGLPAQAIEKRPAIGTQGPLTAQGTAAKVSPGAVTIPKVRVAGPSHPAPLALPSTSEEGENTHVWSALFVHEGKRKRKCTLCNVKVHDDSGSLARHERTSMHQDHLPVEQRIRQLECNLCGKVFRSNRVSSLRRHQRTSCAGHR